MIGCTLCLAAAPLLRSRWSDAPGQRHYGPLARKTPGTLVSTVSRRITYLMASSTDNIHHSSLEGVLFKYGEASPLLALQHGMHSRHLVLVGGLTGGLLYAPYCVPLAQAAGRMGWSTVHAQLSSSYQGYGVSCLDQDADELLQLLQHLQRHRGSTGLVVLGHSTGCQDIVRLVGRHKEALKDLPLKGVVLQAPVSDREWIQGYPELQPLEDQARQMVAAGRGGEVLLRFHIADNAPMSAARFLALAGRLGDDDMFSSDLGTEELRGLLCHMAGLPALLLASTKDEAVPEHVDVRVLAARLAAAMGAGAEVALLEGANHAAEGHEEQLVQQVLAFLQKL